MSVMAAQVISGVCATGPVTAVRCGEPSDPADAVLGDRCPGTSHQSHRPQLWGPPPGFAVFGCWGGVREYRTTPPTGRTRVIEIVYDGQDHHEDCMYPTFSDPEPCLCEELIADGIWPQEPDGA
ncbi:hypothetical protein [Streptomyces sp. TSRI0281]|uniref:hypothetical protein n=2 Tax=unclassified Streptomyces TaxID=2593676 RepID=UPI001A7E0C40|nr:hypothetical protein [Streptomyces sp. TSRI0281]